MMNKKKLRLILVNNPTASLFMASWFEQNRYDQSDEWENIGVYSVVNFSKEYSENIEEKKQIYQTISCDPLKSIVDIWLTCCPDEYDSYCFELNNLMAAVRERRKRLQTIRKIYVLFEGVGIALHDVQEIWTTSNCLGHYFKYICSQARFVYFEHGLSDIRYILQTNGFTQYASDDVIHKKVTCFAYIKNVLRGWYYRLNKYWEDKITLFKKDFTCDEYVSVFGNEIREARHIANLKVLDEQNIVFLVKKLTKDGVCVLKSLCIDGNIAIILMESIKPFGITQNDHHNFFRAFEQHVLDSYLNIFLKHGIKNVLFKPRFFFEEYAQEAFKAFDRLRIYFNLFFLPDYSYKNYPIEFYLSELQPRIILGAYSSGLFYSKKLMKKIDTYSYDTWYIEYCKRHYGTFYQDYVWLRPFFESGQKAFVPYVPFAGEK